MALLSKIDKRQSRVPKMSAVQAENAQSDSINDRNDHNHDVMMQFVST
jgi:hypothetical protein